jgi:hypothetical protein
MKLYLLFLTLFFSIIALGQKGNVSGTITDKEFNDEALAFANISIKGTSIGTSTDDKGKYNLSLEPGNYVLVIAYLGYQTIEIPFNLNPSEKKIINYSLEAGGVQLKDVVLTTIVRKNTESAVLTETKVARQVTNSISAEQMSKGTDGNAAQAIQRVPGVTIVDGKFIMIRGLNERYNNVLINNSLAPSTEIDRRTFSFDLLPTSTLEKMTIGKTGASFLPGDFAGGIINVTTSENFSDFTQLSFNVGYRVNTTFDDYWQTEGSPTDFLGYDNGFRQLPSGFPTNSNVLNDNNQSVFYANQLENNFNPEKRSSFLDSGIGFSIGRNINLKNDKKLSTVNILSYSNKFENYDKNVNSFINDFSGGVNIPQEQKVFVDNFNSNETRLTLMSNWSLKFNEDNKINFKNLFNQIGENFTTLREGFDYDQRPGQLLRNYEFGYTGRRILSSQFNGDHNITDNKNIHWVLGGNFIKDIMPDLRRFRTFRNINETNEPFKMIDPPSSNPFDTGRFFSDLNEKSINASVDYTYKVNKDEEEGDEFEADKITLKTGLFTDYKDRDFSARYFSYIIPGSVSFERKEELISLPLSQIFAPANVTATNGWVLREGSNLSDSYTANNLLTAGYVYGEYPIEKFLLTGGVRIEHNILQVNGFQGINKVLIEQPITSVLPSFNFSYNANEKNVMRLAYSRTVNRPEFREIAPFLFYNFQEDTEVDGNSNLTTATIDNFDARYEIYPSSGETVSLGAFYKRFKNPIEYILPVVSQQRRMRYSNSESAELYGAELELRKSMKNIFKAGFLSDLSVNLNASYIFSEVDLGSAANAQQQKRALQGQSPYVVNFALGYNNKENGWNSNLIYNRFGDRIFAVGGDIFPTIYELARNQLDFTISKSFEKMSYKLGISNLLDDKYRFFQDSNLDNKINKSDDAIFTHRIGALFNFNVTYKF